MNERIPVSEGQQKLAVVWFVGCGLLFLGMIALSITGRFGGQLDRAWSWFLPTFFPTLALIITVLVYDAKNPTEATVGRFIFRLSWGLSAFYLLVIAGTLVLHPLSSMTPIELMDVSGFWIASIQGLVTAALGVFFVSREA